MSNVEQLTKLLPRRNQAAILTPVLDEYHYFFAPSHEGLKRELRELPGVPNASYVVSGDKVFVFKKLVELVSAAPSNEEPLAERVARCLPQAWVSVRDAVTEWDVIPNQFLELVPLEGDDSRVRIWHPGLSAYLPGIYSREEAKDVLVGCLQGRYPAGPGNASYHGAVVDVQDSYALDSLPPKPPVLACRPMGVPFKWLMTAQFSPGFSEVTRDYFDQLYLLEDSWKLETGGIQGYVADNADKLFEAVLTTAALEALEPRGPTDEPDPEVVAQLRASYPELTMFSDAKLQHLFEDFHFRKHLAWRGPTSRDALFIVFLVQECLQQGLIEVPESVLGLATSDEGVFFVLYGLLQGLSRVDAFEQGAAAALYDESLSKLACRVKNAMDFAGQHPTLLPLQGPPIVTLLDLYMRTRIR